MALEQLSPLMASEFGGLIGLTAAKAFRSRAVELDDPLDLGNRTMRITDIGQRKLQLPQGRSVFGLESELVDNVPGLAVLIIIDVDGVKDFVIEVEIVRAIGGILGSFFAARTIGSIRSVAMTANRC